MLHVVFLAQMVRLKMIVHHFLAFKTLHDIAFILGLLALTRVRDLFQVLGGGDNGSLLGLVCQFYAA